MYFIALRKKIFNHVFYRQPLRFLYVQSHQIDLTKPLSLSCKKKKQQRNGGISTSCEHKANQDNQNTT